MNSNQKKDSIIFAQNVPQANRQYFKADVNAISPRADQKVMRRINIDIKHMPAPTCSSPAENPGIETDAD